MNMNFKAACYLHAFENNQPIDGGFLHDGLLRTYKLDYSVSSLARIDDFLDAIRATNTLTADNYLDSQASQNLLYYLCFYVGEVISRKLQSPPWWRGFDDFVEGEDVMVLINGRIFEYSLSLDFPEHPNLRTKTLFKPLVSITSRLIEDDLNKSVSWSAGFFIGDVSGDPECNTPLPALPVKPWPVNIAEVLSSHPELRERLFFKTPFGFVDDPIQDLFACKNAILENGRVVWGAVIEVNTLIYENNGLSGVVGRVLYAPDGRVEPGTLFDLSRVVASYKTIANVERDALEEDAQALCALMSDEMSRHFGFDIPRRIIAYPLKMSVTYFYRPHLIGNRLMSNEIPLLIHDDYPGMVLPLPHYFWTAGFVEYWEKNLSHHIMQAAMRGDDLEAYVADPLLAHLMPCSIIEEGLLWSRQGEYAKAKAAWEKAGAKGQAGANYGLGTLYENGHGVEKDMNLAMEYYEKAGKEYPLAEEALARLKGEEVKNQSNPSTQPITLLQATKLAERPLSEYGRWLQIVLDSRQLESDAELRRKLLAAGCPPEIQGMLITKTREMVGSRRKGRSYLPFALLVTMFYVAHVFMSKSTSLLFDVLAGGLLALLLALLLRRR
ncbi:MAG: hypothetical protein RKP46_02360 [Candidatus Accumulibacter sp.]|uniref:hypothetical protein n=1 Tax=Accumulibacter sp. TaxID=2053492 RepID=UPI00287971C7|nr:hypothetical protein [Accumulibacter sp.]MDS4013181.1 hypothetical protein [Accumulibacter sp.]